MRITSYQVLKIKKPIYSDRKICFLSDEYEIRDNKKGSWICTCRFCSDGKTQNKPCVHILGIYKYFDKPKYLSLINDSIKELEKELKTLRGELE